jgi:nucleoid-associated protein YgaU
MALEKALIQPLDEKGNPKGQPVKVLFNPKEYSIEKSNQFQSTTVPGLSTPITQFVSGSAQTLTMELFFDSYEKGEDVRDYTGKLTALLDIDADLHAPLICKFIWGKLEFKATLERVSQRFTMFLDSGIPVRATLSVTFKEYKTMTEQLQSPPRESADRTKRRVIKQGDTLWLIADREYGDPDLWRPIAEANKIDNPRILEIGKEIIIPPLR